MKCPKSVPNLFHYYTECRIFYLRAPVIQFLSTNLFSLVVYIYYLSTSLPLSNLSIQLTDYLSTVYVSTSSRSFQKVYLKTKDYLHSSQKMREGEEGKDGHRRSGEPLVFPLRGKVQGRVCSGGHRDEYPFVTVQVVSRNSLREFLPRRRGSPDKGGFSIT